MARGGSGERRSTRRALAGHLRREMGCAARAGAPRAARYPRHVLRAGTGRGAVPGTHRGDRGRGTRARASRLHAHVAHDAHPRRRTDGAREGARGPPSVRLRRRRVPVAVMGLQRQHRGAPAGAGFPLFLQLHGRPQALPPRGERPHRTPGAVDPGRRRPFLVRRLDLAEDDADRRRGPIDLGGRVPRLPPAAKVRSSSHATRRSSGAPIGWRCSTRSSRTCGRTTTCGSRPVARSPIRSVERRAKAHRDQQRHPVRAVRDLEWHGFAAPPVHEVGRRSRWHQPS